MTGELLCVILGISAGVGFFILISIVAFFNIDYPLYGVLGFLIRHKVNQDSFLYKSISWINDHWYWSGGMP